MSREIKILIFPILNKYEGNILWRSFNLLSLQTVISRSLESQKFSSFFFFWKLINRIFPERCQIKWIQIEPMKAILLK